MSDKTKILTSPSFYANEKKMENRHPEKFSDWRPKKNKAKVENGYWLHVSSTMWTPSGDK